MTLDMRPSIPSNDGERDFVSLSSFCRDWRIKEGYTQEYIAIKSGVSKSAICRFEKGNLVTNKIISGYIKSGLTLPEEMLIEYITYGR